MDRTKIWTDIQRRKAEGKKLFLGDTEFLFDQVARLTERLDEADADLDHVRFNLASRMVEVERLASENAGLRHGLTQITMDLYSDAATKKEIATSTLAEAVRP